MKIALVLAAAGSSSRLKGSEPKQFRELAGIPLYEWTLRKADRIPGLRRVIVVVPAGLETAVCSELAMPVRVVAGGPSRYRSVRRGLEVALREGCDVALVHDAARPFATTEMFERVIDGLRRGAAAVAPVVPIPDTVKRLDGSSMATVERTRLRRAQTPQGLMIEKVLAGYDAATTAEGAALRADVADTEDEPTDDVAMAEIGGLDVVAVEGDPLNLKITYQQDWDLAEALVACGLVPVPRKKRLLPVCEEIVGMPPGGVAGTGFDVHRLVDGIPLYLGGVEIPYPRGLAGHSDGDAVSHAVADALLGAARLGDIGTLYPSSDERNRGRRSTEFLREITEMLRRRALSIFWVDVTVIAQEPRLDHYRESIARSLAGALSIQPERVSIKATTTDGLGMTGSGEGIAALATAVIGPDPRLAARRSDSIR